MQTLRRCAYARASYNEDSVHDLYDEKKARLEKFCRKIMQLYRDRKLGNGTLSVSAVYSKTKNITVTIYKGRLFLGFQDKKTGQISFDDTSGEFVKMAEEVLEQLEIRMMNAMDAMEKGRPFLMSQELAPHWDKLTPLMDKIIEYETEFERFPKVKQIVLENSGIRDKQINDLIAKMEPQLHPLIEEALEEMYGMDVGKSGKRDELSAMSNIEEDRAEKQYHMDLGNSGRMEKSVCSTPLSERFAAARQEAQDYKASKEEKEVKKEIDKDKDWRMPDST